MHKYTQMFELRMFFLNSTRLSVAKKSVACRSSQAHAGGGRGLPQQRFWSFLQGYGNNFYRRMLGAEKHISQKLQLLFFLNLRSIDRIYISHRWQTRSERWRQAYFNLKKSHKSVPWLVFGQLKGTVWGRRHHKNEAPDKNKDKEVDGSKASAFPIIQKMLGSSV